MNRQKAKGFTIIEVVLVLAIAALIFLMVFIAVPALQKSQRDTERKNDAGIVSSSVTKFTSAYRRPIAAGDKDNLLKYIDDLSGNYGDPDNQGGISYNNAVEIDATGKVAPTKDTIVVYPEYTCDGPGVKAGSKRDAAVRIQLEDETYYCVTAS